MTTSPPQLSNPNRVELTQLDYDRVVVWVNRSTPERAVATIGLRRVLEAIGIDKVVKFCIEEYGIDEVIKVMLENHRKRMSEPAEPLAVGVLPSSTPRVEPCRESSSGR